MVQIRPPKFCLVFGSVGNLLEICDMCFTWFWCSCSFEIESEIHDFLIGSDRLTLWFSSTVTSAAAITFSWWQEEIWKISWKYNDDNLDFLDFLEFLEVQAFVPYVPSAPLEKRRQCELYHVFGLKGIHGRREIFKPQEWKFDKILIFRVHSGWERRALTILGSRFAVELLIHFSSSIRSKFCQMRSTGPGLVHAKLWNKFWCSDSTTTDACCSCTERYMRGLQFIFGGLSTVNGSDGERIVRSRECDVLRIWYDLRLNWTNLIWIYLERYELMWPELIWTWLIALDGPIMILFLTWLLSLTNLRIRSRDVFWSFASSVLENPFSNFWDEIHDNTLGLWDLMKWFADEPRSEFEDFMTCQDGRNFWRNGSMWRLGLTGF